MISSDARKRTWVQFSGDTEDTTKVLVHRMTHKQVKSFWALRSAKVAELIALQIPEHDPRYTDALHDDVELPNMAKFVERVLNMEVPGDDITDYARICSWLSSLENTPFSELFNEITTTPELGKIQRKA
jgi:hypothetical protein